MISVARRHPVILFFLLSGAWTFLLYGSSLFNPFVYDDVSQIEQNGAIASLSGTFQYFLAAVPFNAEYRGIGGSFYRPLFWASLAADQAAWGIHASGFHATNLFLHWFNGFLLFLLLSRLQISAETSALSALVWIGMPGSGSV